MVAERPVHIFPVSSALSLDTGEIVFAAQKQVLSPVLPHSRKAVCSWLFTFGFPSVLSLVPRCASAVLGLSLLSAHGFQSDDGVVWLRCVRLSSWINASSSVCLTSIMLGVFPCAGLQQLWGRGLWFQQLLMSPFTPQLVGVGLVLPVWGQPCPHAHS